MAQMKPLMTLAEVAVITRFEVDVVMGWIKDRKICGINFDGQWRIREIDLLRMLDNNATIGPLEKE